MDRFFPAVLVAPMWLCFLGPGKPLMLAEFGSVEDANDLNAKANWITYALLTQMPNNFPAIKAVLSYNYPGSGYNSTIPIESSTNAQNAIDTAIASPIYATNSFGNISQSPILPLK